MSFKTEFEDIVVKIAKEAMAQATSFADRIEALKALNTSYGLMMKWKGEEEAETSEFSFDKGITEEAIDGAAKIRTRPGGRSRADA